MTGLTRFPLLGLAEIDDSAFYFNEAGGAVVFVSNIWTLIVGAPR